MMDAKDGKSMQPAVTPVASQSHANVVPSMGAANPTMAPSYGLATGHPDGSYIE